MIGRVSERRLDYLTASFRQAGLSRTDAQHRARLLYAAYVGFLQLNLQLHQTRMQHDEFEAYVEHMMATLIPVSFDPSADFANPAPAGRMSAVNAISHDVAKPVSHRGATAASWPH